MQADGRCRFFKWQDELGSGQTPPQQRSQPQTGSGPAESYRPSHTPQGAPAAAIGGSGVFADGVLVNVTNIPLLFNGSNPAPDSSAMQAVCLAAYLYHF